MIPTTAVQSLNVGIPRFVALLRFAPNVRKNVELTAVDSVHVGNSLFRLRRHFSHMRKKRKEKAARKATN